MDTDLALVLTPCSLAAGEDPGVVLHQIKDSYISCLVENGATPVMVPSGVCASGLRALYDLTSAVLLIGGADIDPQNYGEKPHPNTKATAPKRDEVELQVARWAHQDRKPLFGICRGIQIINVALGGTLIQDIPTQKPSSTMHQTAKGRAAHPLELKQDSLLSKLLGGKTIIETNSSHHQAVANLSPELRAVGWAPDGIIEVVESKSHPFFFAVQGHPEDLWRGPVSPWSSIFRALVGAAKQFKATH